MANQNIEDKINALHKAVGELSEAIDDATWIYNSPLAYLTTRQNGQMPGILVYDINGSENDGVFVPWSQIMTEIGDTESHIGIQTWIGELERLLAHLKESTGLEGD